jgi:hypothetical protein
MDNQPDYYPTICPEAISRETASMSHNFLPGGSIAPSQVSPFILHLLYRTCAILSNTPQERRMGDDVTSLSTLRGALNVLTDRWLASGKILWLYHLAASSDCLF